MRARRAERHPDPELAGPLRHRVRHHAVQPHGRQHQPQHGERPEKPSHYVFLLYLRLSGDPVFQVQNLPVDLLIGVYRIHLLAYRMQQGERRDLRPDQDLREHPHKCRGGTKTSGLIGLRRPSSSLSATTPTIWRHPAASGAARAYGGWSWISGILNEWPMASPFGKYRCAIVWLITATRAPLRFSVSSQMRPCAIGIRNTGKYVGLTRFTSTFCSSCAVLPRNSTRIGNPLAGGVALLEIAVIVTPGAIATFFCN